MEKECLDKSRIITLLKSDFNTKRANAYLAVWFVFVVLLEVYVYFKHGIESILKNWMAVPVLLAGGLALYMIFRYFNSANVKNVEECVNSDNIVVLETTVVKVKKGGGLSELYFVSKHYGKHSIIANETTVEEVVQNVTRFYLVLTKEKSKYNLALALPANEWCIAPDLDKYKICE